jgi:hypothetical protein
MLGVVGRSIPLHQHPIIILRKYRVALLRIRSAITQVNKNKSIGVFDYKTTEGTIVHNPIPNPQMQAMMSDVFPLSRPYLQNNGSTDSLIVDDVISNHPQVRHHQSSS